MNVLVQWQCIFDKEYNFIIITTNQRTLKMHRYTEYVVGNQYKTIFTPESMIHK